MALKALKCPNCDANIQVDDDREYGFCAYCGAQVQIKEVVEIRHTGTIKIDESARFEKQMEDGTAYLKISDYYKAEQAFYRITRDYPGRVEGYEMLISAITRNHKVYIKENYDRVMKMAEKMLAVAPDERKDYYENLYHNICQNFEMGIQEQNRQETFLRIGRMNKLIKENLIIFFVFSAAFIICCARARDSIWFPVLSVFFSAIAGVAAIMVIGCKLRKDALLRKETN